MELNKLKEYKDKNVAILWFWKEWKSTLFFLTKLWFTNITIIDKNLNHKKEENIKYQLWKNYLKNLSKYELIIKTPWISPYQDVFNWINTVFTSQAEIFTNNYKWKIIGITWTKWKSTTSTILFKTLEWAWYKVKLVWNIWKAVLEEINILEQQEYDYIIFEVSSYMLDWLSPKLFIWYINNIFDCHLDWHNWRENYIKAKVNIIKSSENKIVNIQTKDIVWNIPWITYFGDNTNFLYNNSFFKINWEEILEDKNIEIKWEHNRKNILWIITIIHTLSKNVENFNKLIRSLQSTLSLFNGLPHRQENIWTFKGITFIDDAIASTPDSTVAAIKTFEHNIWTLFLWDMDSWFTFDELKKTIIKYQIPNIVIFPESWNYILWDFSWKKIWETFNFEVENININIFKTNKMCDAVEFAYKNTSIWKICLLSTAWPTFTWSKRWIFNWYIDQWNTFKNEVKKQSQ